MHDKSAATLNKPFMRRKSHSQFESMYCDPMKAPSKNIDIEAVSNGNLLKRT